MSATDRTGGRTDANARGVRALVVGDLMLDRYTEGDAHRISPEAPVPVVLPHREWSTPGGAANAAAGIAALGDTVSVVGLVGDDAAGEAVRQGLVAAGVDAGHVVVAGRPTTSKHRIVAAGQQIVRVDVEDTRPMPPGAEAAVLRACAELLPVTDVVLLSDYAKGVCSAQICRGVIDLARRAGLPVLVDPKHADFTRYRGASLVTPNLAEARLATGGRIADVDAMGAELLGHTGGDVLVTRGPDGMSLYRGGSAPLHLPATTHQVFDVTGAGDTVVAVLAAALGRGLGLPDACRLANEAAAIAVSRHGVVTIGKRELLARARAAGLFDGAELADVADAADQTAVTVTGAGLPVS